MCFVVRNGIMQSFDIRTFSCPSTEVMWITVERILDGAPTSIGAMSGAVAGLVTCQASRFVRGTVKGHKPFECELFGKLR